MNNSSLSVTRSFRNHSNMLICNISYYSNSLCCLIFFKEPVIIKKKKKKKKKYIDIYIILQWTAGQTISPIKAKLYAKSFSNNKNLVRLVIQSRVRLVIQRFRVRISGPAGIEGGDCEWTALSPPSIPWLRCPWARHRTPNCSPGAGAMAAHCSGCVLTVCVFTTHCCVCALGWVKCRGPISSMGHHTWQYITYIYIQYIYIYIYIYIYMPCW